MPRKKTKKSRPKAKVTREATPKKKARKARPAPKKKGRKKMMILERGNSADVVTYKTRGLGANSAGQAGDTQGLPEVPVDASESVEGLLEEGQTFEAELLDGVENTRDADKSEVKTRQVPEDDVPGEYREKD